MQHMHPEAAQYAHHAANLQARRKTLNRYTYNGIEICQRADGYYIGEDRYETLAEAYAAAKFGEGV